MDIVALRKAKLELPPKLTKKLKKEERRRRESIFGTLADLLARSRGRDLSAHLLQMEPHRKPRLSDLSSRRVKLHDLAGAFALAIEVGFIDDIQFAMPLRPMSRDREIEMPSSAPRRSFSKLFLVLEHRTPDEIARHGRCTN